MAQPQNLLFRSWKILNSCLFFILIAIFLESQVIGDFLPYSFKNSPMIWGFFCLLAGLKIILYSGMYGMLLEIASGEELIFTLARFKENVGELWKTVLVIFSLPIVTHFFCFKFFPQQSITLSLIVSHGDSIFTVLAVYLVLRKKYLRPLSLAFQFRIFCRRDILWVFLLALVNILLYHAPEFLSLPAQEFSRPLAIFFRYSHFLMFILLAQIFLSRYQKITQRFCFSPELYLISPPSPGVLWNMASLVYRAYPYWSIVLRALTPARYHIREFNRVYWHDRYFAEGKLVAVSCFSSFVSADAYKIAKEFKRRGSTVIMGGAHVTALADEALEFCDAVVVGEAEGVWPRIIQDYENGCLQKKYFARENEAAFARVHQFLLNEPPEVIKDCVETTRGCKYNCFFCAVPNLGRTCLRKKPIAEVIELAQKAREAKQSIGFVDNNIYSDPGYTRELLQALKPLGVKWGGSCSIDIGQNDELLSLAQESGCDTLLLGYEISGGSEEKKQGGKLAMAQKYLELSKKIQAKGIGIKAHFIIGFDSDTLRSIWTLGKFCFRLRPFLTMVSVLTPFPGSQFFNDALAQGRVETLNWRRYNCQGLVFKPQKLSPVVLRAPIYPLLNFLFLTLTSRGGLLIVGLVILLFWFDSRSP